MIELGIDSQAVMKHIPSSRLVLHPATFSLAHIDCSALLRRRKTWFPQIPPHLLLLRIGWMQLSDILRFNCIDKWNEAVKGCKTTDDVTLLTYAIHHIMQSSSCNHHMNMLIDGECINPPREVVGAAIYTASSKELC